MFRLSVVAVVMELQYDTDTGSSTRSLLEWTLFTYLIHGAQSFLRSQPVLS